MEFSQPASGGSIFSGYFNQYHQNVYGVPAPQYSVNDMNNMMQRQQQPMRSGGGQQRGGKQESGPLQQAADIYGYYDKAMDAASMFQGEASLAEAEANAPWAAEAAAPAAETTAGGTAAGGTASGGAGTAAGGTAAEGAGYGAAGWYAALAALGYNATGHEWYDPEDIFKGTAMAERWENMDAGKAAGNQVEDIFGEGTGSAMENSSRVVSIDPRESWKGITGLAENQRNLMSNAMDDNREFFKNNDIGKIMSGSGINREIGRGVKNMWSQHETNRSNVTENVKKASNPFKWFD